MFYTKKYYTIGVWKLHPVFNRQKSRPGNFFILYYYTISVSILLLAIPLSLSSSLSANFVERFTMAVEITLSLFLTLSLLAL